MAGMFICLIYFEPLQPGESKSFGGNQFEILTGRHDIGFTTIGMAVIPPVQFTSAWVTQKFFIKTPIGKPEYL